MLRFLTALQHLGCRFPTETPVLSGFTDESKVGGKKVKSRLYDLLVTEETLLGFPAYEYLGSGPIDVDGVEIPDVFMARATNH